MSSPKEPIPKMMTKTSRCAADIRLLGRILGDTIREQSGARQRHRRRTVQQRLAAGEAALGGIAVAAPRSRGSR
jgi:hypothetical protein